MTDSDSTPSGSPLTREMVEAIDATLLPTLERHHLRLLAHCLASFQTMQAPETTGPIPSLDQQRSWCSQQPQLRDDPQFGDLLLQQFQGAARHLETLAESNGITPLELTLSHLIDEAMALARARHQSS